MEDVAADAGTEGTPESEPTRRRFLLRYLRPQTGVTIVLWRVEAYTATPLALLFIATLGRWPAALAKIGRAHV